MSIDTRIGFIGGGNMGQAILTGVLTKGLIAPQNISVYDVDADKLKALAEKTGVCAAATCEDLVLDSHIILLAVKPNVCAKVLSSLGDVLENKALASIVAGFSKQKLQSLVPASCRLLRVMPNMPAMVGQGMTVFEADHSLTGYELKIATAIFEAVGRVESLPSYLMDAVTGVSGSGPAYAFMFIEAMADAAVLNGIPRDTAYRLAAQTVLGAATAVLESGVHPAELKDRVCSPGGTTIEAVFALEQGGMRAAVIDAINVCTKKSEAISKKS
ncbi:MAG: pyrroline-5-carboxylate reductase [Bacillota bacterium]